jgi:hypothetical protein
MSEENLDQTSEIEVDSGLDSGSGDSSNVSNDSALQSRMNGDNDGYWYDEGYGSYIDPTTGEPVHGANGEKIPEGSIDTYLKTQNAKKQPVANQAQPQKNINLQANISSEKGKVNPVISKALNYSYTPASLKTITQPTQSNQPQQPVPEPAKDFKTEYSAYSTQVKELYLAPVERAIVRMKNAGIYTSDNPEAVAQAKEYEDLQQQVKDHLEEKYIEMREKHFETKESSKAEEKAFAALKQEAGQVFGRVAADNGGVAVLEALLFGQNVAGKNVKGPGSDLIYLMFDMAHEGKEIKDFGSELKKWWPTVAKNESALRTLTMLAHAVNIAKNQTKDRAEVRKQTLTQVAQQKRFVKTSPSGTQYGNNSQSARDAALARYTGFDTV